KNTTDSSELLHSLDKDLLLTLPISLQRMQTAIEVSTPFNKKGLPTSLTSHWHSHTGEYKISVYPVEDINDNEALRRFVRAVQQIAPQATGAPMISLEAGEAVVQAFIQAFSLALAGIIVTLLILLRSVKYTILVLVPLLLSSIFIGVFAVLLNLPFNFANIIALPLLLGLGIDSSLHMVHRSRIDKLEGETLIHTSTVRAIFYSALTSLVAFASLMFSSHQGTASMGILLTVGLTLTLICTLVILPVLLGTATKEIRP
ncbi:MAG: hopanoid biosynthesis-associated RND transporter HpnN, partial [Nitrosomonadales bacterium]